MTRVAEEFFPDLCESNNDPRARLLFTDGIKWVADAEAGSYDVIIVDSTDPVGPAAGLFSEDFYRNCYKALRPHGIVVGQSESPLFHPDIIQQMHVAMRAAGFFDVATHNFPQCTYPSGWWSGTMACKDASLSSFRQDAVAGKTFPTRYYNQDMHAAAKALADLTENGDPQRRQGTAGIPAPASGLTASPRPTCRGSGD